MCFNDTLSRILVSYQMKDGQIGQGHMSLPFIWNENDTEQYSPYSILYIR